MLQRVVRKCPSRRLAVTLHGRFATLTSAATCLHQGITTPGKVRCASLAVRLSLSSIDTKRITATRVMLDKSLGLIRLTVQNVQKVASVQMDKPAMPVLRGSINTPKVKQNAKLLCQDTWCPVRTSATSRLETRLPQLF